MTPAVARDSSVKWQATRKAGSANVEGRPLDAADLACAGEAAARREPAARRHRVGAGQHARDRRQRCGALVTQLGNGGDEGLRVRVARALEDLVDRRRTRPGRLRT